MNVEQLSALFEYYDRLVKTLDNRFLTQDIRRELELRLITTTQEIEKSLNFTLPSEEGGEDNG